MDTNPNTITTAVGKWPNLHHWAMRAALLFLLAIAGPARAVSVTNVIYYDTFSRAGALAGTTPDTVDATGATWVGGYPTNGIVTDGTEASITNQLAANPPYENAFLPLNLETGHVYIVTCTIVGNSNAPGTLAFGYSIIPSLFTGCSANANWGIDWVSVNSSNNGCGYWTYGGIHNDAISYPWTPSMTYSSVLNLITNGSGGLTNMTGSLYTNGVLAYNGPAVANGRQTEDSGMYPGYVFIGHQNPLAAGSFQNFSVTDIVLNATAPTILEQPNNLTAPVGQTATFWIGAYALPDPACQWMTNGTAIPGATNASYTTPPLSTAYNGLQYSVQLSTAAGSVTSSSATLTVTAGKPTVYSAVKTASPTNVVVNFSGPVDPATGLNAGNYTLLVNNTPGGSVASVSYGSSSNTVILTTSPLNPNAAYSLAVKNVQDQFGDAINTSTNPVLPAGLVFYLRGDSGVQLDAGGNVAQWQDQTTNGNNASQFFGMFPNVSGLFISSPGARPGMGTIGVNNTPAINFISGNKNYLTMAPSQQMNLFGNLTLYCYASPASTSAANEVFGENNGNIANAFELQLAASTLSPTFLFGDGNTFGSFAAAGPALPVTPHVWAITSQIVGTNNSGPTPTPLTNSIAWFVDGSPYGGPGGVGHNVVSVNYPGAEYSGKPVYIGGRIDHGAYMNGTIGELMLFSGPLSASDRTNVDNYLGQKYSTFSIAQQPQPVTSSNGFTATFNIVAGQGSGHVLFQWQENGTNIPGATASSYTTPALAPSDNGDTFDVVMTLLDGSTVTSSTAGLTVDDVPPYVAAAGMPIWNTNQIIVLFDQLAVDPVTATTVTNYTLNTGTVISAAIGDAPDKVVLTTSPLTWSGNLASYALTVQNVRDLYGNTMATATTPVGVYPFATALWVDANTGVTTNSGGSVTQWNDLSGNGNNLVEIAPGFPSYDPLFATNGLGKPVVRFNATNSSVLIAPTATSLSITSDMSIFAVINYATLAGSTNGHIISKTGLTGNSHGNQPGPFDYYAATNTITFYRGNGVSGPAAVTSGQGPSAGFTHLLDVMQQGAAVTHRLDGNPNGSGTLSTTIADAGQSLYVGARSDNSQRLTGDLSAIVLVGSALSSNDVASLENYLAADYHLPLGTNSYPSITKQPVAGTNVYETTTFSVPVGVSGNPLAFNWYDINGAIAGQVAATLTITNAQTSDTYYLVVTNNWGSIISSNVAVTVIPVNTQPTNIVWSLTNNQMVLSWPADHTGWQLQVQTNSLSTGLGTNWVKVPGSSTTDQVAVPINPANPSVFLRMVFPPQ